MKKNKKILIIYDDNKISGKGHSVRSKNLFEYLNNYYKTSLSPFSEINKFKNKIDKFDLVILDLKKYTIKKLNLYFKNYKKKIITIENYNNRFGDINIKIFDHSPNIITNSYIGLRFAIIKKKKISRIIKNNQIFVSIGSKPKKKYLNMIKLKISILKNYNFIIAPNMKMKNFFTLPNVEYCSESNYYKKFNSSSICITNGGLTLIEALYAKKICFTFPQNKYENNFINFLKKQNLVFGFNLDKINSLNFNEFLKIKKKLNNIVDGNGINRIRKIIKKLFYENI